MEPASCHRDGGTSGQDYEIFVSLSTEMTRRKVVLQPEALVEIGAELDRERASENRSGAAEDLAMADITKRARSAKGRTYFLN